MNNGKLIVASCLVVGSLSAGVARAQTAVDVQWAVTIGTPIAALVFGQAWPAHQPSYAAPVYYDSHRHVYRAPLPPRHGWHAPTRWDRDGDGIPNRFDRVYNPRWDRDGDGIPNRYDRVYNPRWDRDGDGIPNRHDRVYNPRWDRGGAGDRHDHGNGRHAGRRGGGAPNWQDPPDRP